MFPIYLLVRTYLRDRTFLMDFSAVSGLAALKSPSQVVNNLYFRRIIFFRFLSEFHFRSDLYIWDSGGTTASPGAWPEDHGRGRFYVTYVTRARHDGRRMGYPSRQHWSRLAWQTTTTFSSYLDDFSEPIGHLLYGKMALRNRLKQLSSRQLSLGRFPTVYPTCGTYEQLKLIGIELINSTFPLLTRKQITTK